MNQTNTVILAIFVALGVMLVAGLVVIPVVHEAQARSTTINRYIPIFLQGQSGHACGTHGATVAPAPCNPVFPHPNPGP